MSGNIYRGASLGQDGRFSNKDKKIIQSKKWPEIFEQKVDMSKVELQVIKPWISKKVTEIIGTEDEVVENLVISELEAQKDSKRGPNPKEIQLNLTGFLQKNAGKFMMELWKLLLEAQKSPKGIPESLVQDKRDEISKRKEQILLQVNRLQSLQQNMLQVPGISEGGQTQVYKNVEQLFAANNYIQQQPSQIKNGKGETDNRKGPELFNLEKIIESDNKKQKSRQSPKPGSRSRSRSPKGKDKKNKKEASRAEKGSSKQKATKKNKKQVSSDSESNQDSESSGDDSSQISSD